jgi:hypothetical protein
VLTAAGIRLSELAGRRYDPGGPRSSGIDLWQREITVRGTGGNAESHLYPHRFRRHFSHTWPDRARLPLPVVAALLRPADWRALGADLAQDTRWPGVGKRDMSVPVVRHEVAHCE